MMQQLRYSSAYSTCYDCSDEDMLFPSNTGEKQCGDATVVINAVHTPPAVIIMHSSEDNFLQLLHRC